MTKMEIGKAPLTYMICQGLVILFFGLFSEFKEGSDPLADPTAQDSYARQVLKDHYPSF